MKDCNGKALAIGDRVIIRDTEGYFPNKGQGLLVGNTGIVSQLEENTGNVRIATKGNRLCPITRWPFRPGSLEKVVTVPKWQRPGRYEITSYRSFRRYKEAGAQFVRGHSLNKAQDVPLTLAEALTKAKTLDCWTPANPLYAIIEA